MKTFSYEKGMLSPVKSWLKKRIGLIKEEFKLPWGYCDLVGCSLDKKRVSERLELNQRKSIGPQSRVEILWDIPDEETGGSKSFSELTEEFSGLLGRDKLKEEIDFLHDRNFVKKNSNNQLQKRNGWFPLHKKITSIELKLENYREALQQAKSHQHYTSNSYMAFPRPFAEEIVRSSRKQEILDEGVGLLGVSEDWCHTLIEPNENTVKNEVLQAHVVERFWRDYIRNN